MYEGENRDLSIVFTLLPVSAGDQRALGMLKLLLVTHLYFMRTLDPEAGTALHPQPAAIFRAALCVGSGGTRTCREACGKRSSLFCHILGSRFTPSCPSYNTVFTERASFFVSIQLWPSC